MLKRILVGLDGSEYSHSAMEAACYVARLSGATVVGIAVVDIPGIEKFEAGAPGGAIHYAEKAVEHKIRDAEEKTQKLLDEFSAFCGQKKVASEQAFGVGVPFKEIFEEARTSDVVFVGIKTFFHYETSAKPGDTLHRLLEETVSPVLAVPKRFKKPENVLIAYDGSAEAAKALRMFVQLGQYMGAKATVLCVSEEIEESRRLVDRAAKYLAGHDIETETLCLPGEPKIVVHGVALKLMPCIVVMGAYSHSKLHDIFFGSTACHFLEDGTIPLFVYH